jgi:hypothetical protein
MTNLGYPSSINIDFESILNTIDLSNPNINTNEIFAIYRDLLFVLVGERVVIGILLSIPYALTVTIIDSSIKNNFTMNLPVDSSFQGIPKKFSAFEKIKISFEKMIPKLFVILTIAFIINLLIAIGNLLFYIPGILISVFFALAPVIIILEPQISFGSIFSRSRDLIKGSFFKVLGVLMIVVIFQYIITSILELILGIIYFSIQGIDPNSFTDPGFIVLHYISESITAPLTIIAVVILYHDLKFHQKHQFDQRLGITNARTIPREMYQTPQQTPKQPEIKEKTVFCIHCGKPNPNYASFCAFCGKNLQKQLIDEIQQTGTKTVAIHGTQKVCQNCGKPPKKLEDKFCQYCGYKYG